MYWRNGENHNDFISKERYIEPKGQMIFTKPIAVLTNRETYSAAEGFVEMMMLFPQIVLIGGNTGGGSGGTAYYELPNGLTYRITNSDSDISNGIDRILEETIEYLNNE